MGIAQPAGAELQVAVLGLGDDDVLCPGKVGILVGKHQRESLVATRRVGLGGDDVALLLDSTGVSDVLCVVTEDVGLALFDRPGHTDGAVAALTGILGGDDEGTTVNATCGVQGGVFQGTTAAA